MKNFKNKTPILIAALLVVCIGIIAAVNPRSNKFINLAITNWLQVDELEGVRIRGIYSGHGLLAATTDTLTISMPGVQAGDTVIPSIRFGNTQEAAFVTAVAGTDEAVITVEKTPGAATMVTAIAFAIESPTPTPTATPTPTPTPTPTDTPTPTPTP